MKSTGIVRKMDNLGRVVIPKETRYMLDIYEKGAVEIFIEGKSIVLQKYQRSGACLITGEISSRNIKLRDGKLTLSLEGAKQLCEEVKQYLEKI